MMYPIAGALCQTCPQCEHRTTTTKLIRTELNLLDGEHLREILAWLEQTIRWYQSSDGGRVKELDRFCLSGDGMRLQVNEDFVASIQASVSQACLIACSQKHLE